MEANSSENARPFYPPFEDADTFEVYLKIRSSQTTLLPFICGIGFAANVASLIVFLQPSLRRLSCSIYLAAKSVSDFLFLMTVFIIWLARVEIEAFNVSGICQLVVFFSYLTAFVSIWLAVVLTVENLLCVLKPWYVQRSCNATSATVLTAVVVTLGVLLYQFSLWNNGVAHSSPGNATLTEPNDHSGRLIVNASGNGDWAGYGLEGGFSEHREISGHHTRDPTATQAPTEVPPLAAKSGGSKKRCMQLERFSNFIVATTYIDSIITIFVPLIILAFTNSAIVVIAVRSTRKSNLLNSQKAQYQSPGGYHSVKKHSTAAALETQASKFLFLVSVTMLLFHFPSHVIRLKMLILPTKPMDFLLQRIFETLYYTHYAISFFVYLVFGSNFRRVFVALVTRKNT